MLNNVFNISYSPFLPVILIFSLPCLSPTVQFSIQLSREVQDIPTI